MRRKIRLVIMVIFFFSLYYGMNYYVYRSMIRGIQIEGTMLQGIRGFFIFMGSMFVVNQFIKRKKPIYVLTHYGNLWLGFLSIGISMFIIRDLAVFLLPIKEGTPLVASTVIAAILTLVASIYSMINGKKPPIVKTLSISSKKLKGEEKHLVTQLTDIHINAFSSREWLEQMVKRTNETNSDVVVLTGDIIDDRYENTKRFIPIIKELRAKKGVYAIIGNHELYNGLGDFHRFMEEAGIKTLRNQKIALEDNLRIFGLDDYFMKTYEKSSIKPEEVLEGAKGEDFNLLLAHQPLGFPLAKKMGMDLQLSGHTHGGQIPPLEWIIKFYFKYPLGLYREGEAYIYTSPGTGLWGPAMRFMTKNEITTFVIEKE